MLTQKHKKRRSLRHPAVSREFREGIPEGSLAALMIDTDPLALTGSAVTSAETDPRVSENIRDDMVELHDRAQNRPIGLSTVEYFLRRHVDPVAREFHDTGEVEVVRLDDKTEDFRAVIPERVGQMVLDKTVIPLPVEHDRG